MNRKLSEHCRQQTYAQKAVISPLKDKVAAHMAWPGSDSRVIQVVNDTGAPNRFELMSIATAQRVIAKRSETLIDPCKKGTDQMHLVGDPAAPRAMCARCGATGYYALSPSWLQTKCMGTAR